MTRAPFVPLAFKVAVPVLTLNVLTPELKVSVPDGALTLTALALKLPQVGHALWLPV